MRSIFFRIYMGILLAVIVIVMLVSGGTYYVNKQRITTHVEQNYGGTFKLISQGLQRHQAAQREQWLTAIEKLSDLQFQHKNFESSPLSKSTLKKLSSEQFVFHVDTLLTAGQVYILHPNEQQYLQVKLADFGSSLVRLSAFLMLNELGRHKSEQRIQALTDLRAMFHYPIQLQSLSKLHIPTTNVRAVQKGDISVVLKNPTSSTPSLIAYAPLGNSPYALVVGSIPFFDWFPLYMIVLEVGIILLLMAIVSFLLVRPLEQRLQQVDNQIEAIGQDKELETNLPKKGDAIGNLVDTVNAMAKRIHRLIDGQNDMVRAISHELRTPVSRIRFRMAIIEQESPELDKQSEGIERDLTALETLIDEVLTFSKLQRGMPELCVTDIAVSDLYNQLLLSVNATNSNISLCLVNTTVNAVKADYRYLYRALENLVLNAQRYANNKIEIGFSVNETMQKIWVADDGAGIPKEERETLFEPFRRLDHSRDRKTGGYGLGLAIVKQIVNWHKGNISITTSQYDGAKITIEIPIYQPNKFKLADKYHE